MKAIYLLLTLLFTGCQYAPYAEDATTAEPHLNDVVGRYKFESETVVGELKRHLTSQSSLTINPDGTFKAIQLPNFIGSSNFVYKGNISVRGNWKMQTVGRVKKWDGTKSVWGLQLNRLPENLRSMSFIGSPPYKLIITYGDPDGGAVMLFAKH